MGSLARPGRRRPASILLQLLAAALLVVAFAEPARAQADPSASPAAAVAGRVLDPSGGAMRGAPVTITPEGQSGRPRVVVSDAQGAYRLDDLAPGAYRLTVSMPGFEPLSERIVVGTEPVTAILTLAPAALRESVTVSVTRRAESLAGVPAAVTVVSGEDIRDQTSLAHGLPDALGNLVPGLAPGSQSLSLFGQNLRGRRALVLIDGIPQSTTRNVSRDLSTIDPGAIERVEVIRGATALYGDGGTGGVINIITKRPGSAGLEMTTDLGFRGSATHPAGSAGGHVRHTFAGRRGRVQYLLGTAYEHVGGFFDAEGDRVPPDPHRQGGPADTDGRALFAKVRVTPRPSQELGITVNSFRSEQDTRYTNDPRVSALPPRAQKARTISGLSLDDPQGTGNRTVSLDYTNRNVPGGGINAQAYVRDYLTTFFPFDGRAFASQGRVISQSRLDSQKAGGRLNIDVAPFGGRAPRLFGGVDFSAESTEQPVTVMDAAAYDESGGLVFKKVDDRVWVPRMDLRTVGLFLEANWPATARLELRGGVRHERASTSVDDFMTLAGNRAFGGTIRYADTHYNAGAVFHAGNAFQIFGTFAQGFSLPDIGLVLRGAPEGASVGTLPLEAQKVDTYEVGVRAQWAVVQPGLSVFHSRSELGTSSAGFNQPVVRAPERVSGFEASLDVRPGSRFGLGTSVSWTEGKHDPNRDGVFTYLNSWRIPPVKVNAYVDLHVTRWWQNRVQVLHSGDRARFGNSRAFGELPVSSYTVVDLLNRFAAPRGTILLGLHNVLNRHYFLRDSQLLRTGGNLSYAAAQGAVFSLSYTIDY